MDLSLLERLLSESGREACGSALSADSTDATLIRDIERLARTYDRELARAAVEVARLRRIAAGKFSRAAEMFFTKDGLEQSTSEVIARHRAVRLRGYETIIDGCCGIGGDLIALGDIAPTIAVDLDPVRIRFAEENARVYNLSRVEFRQADLISVSAPPHSALFVDPDRRPGGRRVIRPADYLPPIDAVLNHFGAHSPCCFKIAPGVSERDLTPWDAEVEFVSLRGELKECVLWFGPLKGAGRRATVLPTGHTLTADQQGISAEVTEITEVGSYLLDPDPAITRAGLVASLARQLNATQIDPQIAFLTSDYRMSTPFGRTYCVLQSIPFHGKRIGESLRSLGIGPVTILKRGSAVDVDSLRQSWKLNGSRNGFVILTRSLDRPWAIIAEPAENGPNENVN